MTNLNNFNNFELNTEETTNVNGGRCGGRRRRSYSYNRCGTSYNSSCEPVVTICEPAVEEIEKEVEATPVIATPVVEAPTQPVFRGVAGL